MLCFKLEPADEILFSDLSSYVCPSELSTPLADLYYQLTYVREDHRRTVLKATVFGKNFYYAACERVAIADGARIVFAVVCLVRYTPRARDGYIFAYKDMDEKIGRAHV